MSRNINFNEYLGDINYEELIDLKLKEEDESIPKVQKIKKKKRFDDGTPIKSAPKKTKKIVRETEKK